MTEYVSGTALAVHLGCTRETINDYVARKIIKRAANGKYDQDQCRVKVIAHLRSKAGGSGTEALTEERVKLTRAKRKREEMLAEMEAGERVRLGLVTRVLDHMLISLRNRLLNLSAEAAFALAMRPQQECFEILDQMVRDKLEELADPANAAAAIAAAGIESKSGSSETDWSDDNEVERDASDAV